MSLYLHRLFTKDQMGRRIGPFRIMAVSMDNNWNGFAADCYNANYFGRPKPMGMRRLVARVCAHWLLNRGYYKMIGEIPVYTGKPLWWHL